MEFAKVGCGQKMSKGGKTGDIFIVLEIVDDVTPVYCVCLTLYILKVSPLYMYMYTKGKRLNMGDPALCRGLARGISEMFRDNIAYDLRQCGGIVK